MAYFRPLFRMARGVSRLMRKTRLARRIPKFRPRRVYKKKIANKVHRYLRMADKDTQYPGVTGPNAISETQSDQNLAYSFKLDNIINPSDFTNLYDQYRINKVTLMLEPVWTSNGQFVANLNIQNRKIRVVHDYNDNNPLSQEDDYLEYSNCKSYSPIRNIKITLYPKINNVVENAGGAASAFTSMSSNKVWLNIAEDEVPHFGLKIFIPANISNVNEVPLFRVRAKFDLSFKNSK